MSAKNASRPFQVCVFCVLFSLSFFFKASTFSLSFFGISQRGVGSALVSAQRSMNAAQQEDSGIFHFQATLHLSRVRGEAGDLGPKCRQTGRCRQRSSNATGFTSKFTGNKTQLITESPASPRTRDNILSHCGPINIKTASSTRDVKMLHTRTSTQYYCLNMHQYVNRGRGGNQVFSAPVRLPNQ